MPATDRPTPASAYAAPRSVVRAVEAIRSGRLTRAALMSECVRRMADSEAAVRAFLDWRGNDALAQARAADDSAVPDDRPLAGIPFAVKDIVDVAGAVTTAASRVTDRMPASRDAEIVHALRQAGAICIGKANTHEFAYGATTPPTRNPYDPDRIAGGSSGGSAAAVAAGSALLAVGSDTGGSIRLPAALCGVAAWRPLASEEIGTGGILPLAPEFDQWGLIAATSADLEFTWRMLAHRSEPAADGIEFLVPRNLLETIPAVSGDVASAFDREVKRLVDEGARVVPVDIVNFARWSKPRMAIQMRAVLEGHRSRGWWPDRRNLYGAEARHNMESAEAREREDLSHCREEIAELDSMIDALLGPDRVILTPTTPVTAPLASDLETLQQRPGERHPIVSLLGQATLPVSRNDLTTLTVPAREVDYMPVGIQLVADREDTLFRAAAVLGRNTG